MFRNFIVFFMLLFLMPVYAAPVAPVTKQAAPVAQHIKVTPLDIVNNPGAYLNKQIEFTGKFDKFVTLGLDYKKALRESTKYIAFLIQRDDVNHNIPLSELKLFVIRTYAEKFVDLNTGDKIKLKGKVFSNALGDPWVDIESIEVIEKISQEK